MITPPIETASVPRPISGSWFGFRVLQAIGVLLIAFLIRATAGAAPLPARDIGIEVLPYWGARPLLLTTEQGTDASGATVTVSRLDFLLSGVALQGEDGSWWEPKDWFACVRSDPGKYAALLEGVPSRKYTGIRFNVGVDPLANATDPATRAPGHPLHPLVNGLHCGPQRGYVFFALEGRYQQRDGAFAGYSYHITNNENLMRVVLPIALEATGAGTIRLALDVEKLFRGKNPINIATHGSFTRSHEGDRLAASLKQNVETAFRVKSIISNRDQNLAGIARPSARNGALMPVQYALQKSAALDCVAAMFATAGAPLRDSFEERTELPR